MHHQRSPNSPSPRRPCSRLMLLIFDGCPLWECIGLAAGTVCRTASRPVHHGSSVGCCAQSSLWSSVRKTGALGHHTHLLELSSGRCQKRLRMPHSRNASSRIYMYQQVSCSAAQRSLSSSEVVLERVGPFSAWCWYHMNVLAEHCGALVSCRRVACCPEVRELGFSMVF